MNHDTVRKLKVRMGRLVRTNIPLKYIMVAIILLILLLALIHWGILGRCNVETSHSFEDTIGIKDVVAKVQKELMESEIARRMEKREGLFIVQAFDLEINFVVKSIKSASGKADLKLATVDSKHEYSAEKVQKIKLHMAVKPPFENAVGPSSREQIDFSDVQTHGPVPPSKDPEK